jgi:hypothetical protein
MRRRAPEGCPRATVEAATASAGRARGGWARHERRTPRQRWSRTARTAREAPRLCRRRGRCGERRLRRHKEGRLRRRERTLMSPRGGVNRRDDQFKLFIPKHLS